MNELERRINQSLRALDEAHRLARLTREQYRARRRELLVGLSDSNGVTARNAIVPPPAPLPPRRDEGSRMSAVETLDEVAALFPERRAGQRRLWLLVGAMVLATVMLVLWMLCGASA